MQKFCDWVITHTTEIGGVISFVLIFLLGRGYIAADVATMIAGILGVFGISIKPIQRAYAAGKAARGIK